MRAPAYAVAVLCSACSCDPGWHQVPVSGLGPLAILSVSCLRGDPCYDITFDAGAASALITLTAEYGHCVLEPTVDLTVNGELLTPLTRGAPDVTESCEWLTHCHRYEHCDPPRWPVTGELTAPLEIVLSDRTGSLRATARDLVSPRTVERLAPTSDAWRSGSTLSFGWHPATDAIGGARFELYGPPDGGPATGVDLRLTATDAGTLDAQLPPVPVSVTGVGRLELTRAPLFDVCEGFSECRAGRSDVYLVGPVTLAP